jgi:hypothetical protein
VKPASELAAPFVKDLESAASGLGVHVEVLNANTAREIDAAFDHVPHEPGCGMVFGCNLCERQGWGDVASQIRNFPFNSKARTSLSPLIWLPDGLNNDVFGGKRLLQIRPGGFRTNDATR